MKKIHSLFTIIALLFNVLLCFSGCDNLGFLETNSEETQVLLGQLEALKKEINTLENEVNAFESEVSDLNNKLAAKENTIVELCADIKVLEAEKETLNVEISKLELMLEFKDGTLSSLESDINELKVKADDLQIQIDALESEKKILEAEIVEFETDISVFTAKIEEFNLEKTGLLLQIEQLTEEINRLSAENDRLVDENNRLTDDKDRLTVENNILKNCLSGKHTYLDGNCSGCGIDQPYTRDGDYIYLGEYPQSIKEESVEITHVVDSRGYYLGSDGFYYAKLLSKVRTTVYKFTNGEGIEKEKEYYFKVEPIRWRILSEENGEALIVCDSIIYNLKYQEEYVAEGTDYYTTANGAPELTYANNYKYSTVRSWMNNDFLNGAFTATQRDMILTTEIDNSVGGTGYESNDYVCENTFDKVFVLSYAESINHNYGFAEEAVKDLARSFVVSDYSRANGALINTVSAEYGYGYWWLRSPINTFSMIVRNISTQGTAGGNISIYNDYVGVVPAMKITL